MNNSLLPIPVGRHVSALPLLAVLLLAIVISLQANLLMSCPRCSGTGDCECRRVSDERGLDRKARQPDGLCGGGAASASLGSLRLGVPFGAAAHEVLERQVEFSLYALSMTRPNGVATAWMYEPHRDLVTQVQNGTISSYGFVNDAVGRRASMSRSGSAYAAPDTIASSYNDRSELTRAASNVDVAYSYAYAPIGNRVSASEAGVPWTYTTNGLNQYTTATEGNAQLSFAYDLDGSMTYRPVSATEGWTQVWNAENRMAETSKGTDRLTFKYDYLGRRVEKCVYSGNTLVSKTLYVYDGFKCVEELDALDGNALLRSHAWQPFDVGLDVILATTDAAGTSFFLHDANKNVMQRTAADGALLEAYAYAPFGQTLGAATPRVGFSSEVNEEVTRLLYYNFRYLIPCIARWTSLDPIGEMESINLYGYVMNKAINKVDLLGLTEDPNFATTSTPQWIPQMPFTTFC